MINVVCKYIFNYYYYRIVYLERYEYKLSLSIDQRSSVYNGMP